MSSSSPVRTASFITARALARPSIVSCRLRFFCSCSYSSTISLSDIFFWPAYFFQFSNESNRKAIASSKLKVQLQGYEYKILLFTLHFKRLCKVFGSVLIFWLYLEHNATISHLLSFHFLFWFSTGEKFMECI